MQEAVEGPFVRGSKAIRGARTGRADMITTINGHEEREEKGNTTSHGIQQIAALLRVACSPSGAGEPKVDFD